jgi:fibro-slime domain-containing protein
VLASAFDGWQPKRYAPPAAWAGERASRLQLHDRQISWRALASSVIVRIQVTRSEIAIEVGGVHNAEDAAIDIDARATGLGLVEGKVDMFQNERHTADSNLHADTILNFVDCGTIVPEVPESP